MARPVDPPRAAEGERIAKLLARAGVASRREVERMVADGRVARDGVVLDTPATVLPSLAGVTVDGRPVAAPEATRLFLYHKPTGLLVTERDPAGRPTIYDRLPPDLPRVVPVGRLDLNTEGLLLLTTDGGFKRQLELPATGVERTYRARAYGRVSQDQLEELIHGIEINGMRYGSIDANLERRTGANFWIEMTLTEGKNREVRRVLDFIGLEVSRLIRTRYGPFVLGDLPPGAVGEVRAADLTAFRHALANKRRDDVRIAVTPGGTGPTRRPTRPRADGPPVATSTRPARNARPGDSVPARPARPARTPASRPQPDSRQRAGRDDGGGVADAPQANTRLQTRPRENPGAATPRPPRDARPPDTARPRTPVARPSPQPDPGPRRGGDKADTAPPPRPAKPQRKAGWAKPRPKPGARPPKKR